jgi:hypothetical protein
VRYKNRRLDSLGKRVTESIVEDQLDGEDREVRED